MWTARDNRVFLPVLAGLIVAAWLALVAWDVSPYARYLHHDTLEGVRLGHDWPALGLLVLGWTLMTVAMMLPTSLPLIALFHRMTGSRADHGRLVALLLAGYLGVWALFGVVAHLGDLGLHRAIDASAVLERHEWAIGVATLLLAGGYQFSRLKYRCLEQCRSPLSFIMGRWTGRAPGRRALRLGAAHGLFCLGCCWSLMLVMF
ncbi:MAG TPA: DUF2182 domain-containing protein, partial [Thermomicrobiales bacterium]|nr:DUF2182 domain-containing protein [Thermomicrobiales bacterium]